MFDLTGYEEEQGPRGSVQPMCLWPRRKHSVFVSYRSKIELRMLNDHFHVLNDC